MPGEAAEVHVNARGEEYIDGIPLRVPRVGDDSLHFLPAVKQPFREQESSGKFLVMTRGAHGDADRPGIDLDFQRLFVSQVVRGGGDASCLPAMDRSAHATDTVALAPPMVQSGGWERQSWSRSVLECGGKAQPRHRFRASESLSEVRLPVVRTKSGVALRFPPQSMTRIWHPCQSPPIFVPKPRNVSQHRTFAP